MTYVTVPINTQWYMTKSVWQYKTHYSIWIYVVANKLTNAFNPCGEAKAESESNFAERGTFDSCCDFLRDLDGTGASKWLFHSVTTLP